MTSSRFFHGGAPGFQAGDRLLPPSETGARSEADLVRDLLGRFAGQGIARRDRVYASSELDSARLYAALARGDVYEVELDPPVEADPAAMLGSEFGVCAPSGRILGVVERGVQAEVALAVLRREIKALEARS